MSVFESSAQGGGGEEATMSSCLGTAIVSMGVIGFISTSVRALGKGQDIVFSGETKMYKWGVLMDGHGSNAFRDLLLTFPWDDIMSSVRDPEEHLMELIEQRKHTYGKDSGATLLMMKAYPDRIETISIGDSEIAIWKNGALSYKSTPHNRRNPLEVDRLSTMNVHYDIPQYPVPVIATSMKMQARKGEYATFKDGTRIAPTQAIGHNGVTGFASERHVEFFDPARDHVRCILGSDGFYDMFLVESEEAPEDAAQDHIDALSMTAEELVQKAADRWSQSWFYHWNPEKPEVNYSCVFPAEGGRDDVSVVVFDNRRAV